MGTSIGIRHLGLGSGLQRGVNALHALEDHSALICNVTGKVMFKVKDIGHIAAYSPNPTYPLSEA